MFLMLSTWESVIPEVVYKMSLEENRKRYSNKQSHGLSIKWNILQQNDDISMIFGLNKQSRPIHEHNQQNKCSASLVVRMQ